jgi:class 3 adenylate cyclase/tetratricopeptide (TPR) repeat protein
VSEPGFSVPEGPVTIMFTDIEGSTALRTSLGDSETDELFKQHDELVRAEISNHRGHDQKAALGDGFLAVFVSTRRALACAVAIQRALDGFNRTRTGAALRVRIGLNTGEVAAQDGQLSGEAVHAASRVCAAAMGSQILISDVTRQLAGTIPDISFLDAGEHDLKGFPHPWRLWEVIWVRESAAATEQVFVGREQELAFLRSKMNAALDGKGSLVFVGGEPGVGKTTLVKRLIREAEKRGALSLFGRCYESEGAVPYSPFIEMLEQGLGIMPAEILREDLADDAPEVARMIPELRRRFPDIPQPLDLPPEQQRRYFFNAVGSFVGRAAARFPLVLVLDDVHWADQPTLLLIEHMASLLTGIRVLGVGTYRDVELDVSRPLAATMERLVRERTLERLPVKRFNREGVSTMISALAGRPAPDALVDAVFDETEGNPFFVEEVFRHLVEEGKVFDESGAFRTNIRVNELDVPESVRLVVGRRLERLGPEAQKALAAGAVVGRGFPFSLLEQITEIDMGSLLDIVEEAEAARVIVPEQRDGEIHYSFAHELIRQTLLTSLSLLRRQRLHLSVANAIERTDRTARETKPSEIAHHLVQAGAAADPERTLDYLRIAADRAMDSAAFEEALRSIDDALSVLGDGDATERAGLLEQKGWAVRALGHFEECLDIWDGVVDSYRDLGRAEEAAQLCREMAYQYLWLGRFDDVLMTNQRGLDILGDRRTASRAYLVSGIGALLGVAGLANEAFERIAEAEEIGRELDDERVLGWVNWTKSVACFSNTKMQDGIAAGELATEQLRRSGDLWTMCDALSWTGLAAVNQGLVDQALAVASEGVELSRKLGHRGGEILSFRTVLAVEFMRHNDLERWERDVRYDLDLCQSINSPWVSQSYAWLGAVTQLRGRVDEAATYIQSGIEVEPESAYAGLCDAFMVQNRAFAGDNESFRARFEKARDRLPGSPRSTPLSRFAMPLCAGHGAAVLGDAEIAAELYPMLTAIKDRFVVGFVDCSLAERVCGMLAAVTQRWDEADGHFEDARRQAQQLPIGVEIPQIDHWHGKMLLDRGRPEDADRARQMIGSAVDSYKGLGMPLHVEWADGLLASV